MAIRVTETGAIRVTEGGIGTGYTFINAINIVAEKLGIIQGPDQAVTTIVGDPRADDLNCIAQAWNECMQEMSDSPDLLPSLTANGTFALVSGQREYAIPTANASELVVAGTAIELVDSVINQTRKLPLFPYNGGYQQMIIDQPDPSIFLGSPVRWAVSPVTGQIRFDFTPQSGDAGNTIQVYGTPRISLANTTDQFPFTNTVVDQLVPAVAERWKKLRRPKEYSADEENAGMANAIRWVRREPSAKSYGLTRRRRR